MRYALVSQKDGRIAAASLWPFKDVPEGMAVVELEGAPPAPEAAIDDYVLAPDGSASFDPLPDDERAAGEPILTLNDINAALIELGGIVAALAAREVE